MFSILAAFAMAFPAGAFAQNQPETLPPIGEYVISDEMGERDKEGFLAGLTEATAANPSNAAAIVQAALESKMEEIKESPAYATEIVLAVLAGIPENLRLPDFIASILDTAISALQALPAGQKDVPAKMLEAVIASLPPDLALQVRNFVTNGPEGALRDLVIFIYTAPPTGGADPTPTPEEEEDEEEEEEPTEDKVTPTDSVG